MAGTSPPQGGVPSAVTATAMRILRLLAADGAPASPARVARCLELGESEAKRLLDRLAEEGFAERTGDGYLLGERIVRLARRLTEDPFERR